MHWELKPSLIYDDLEDPDVPFSPPLFSVNPNFNKNNTNTNPDTPLTPTSNSIRGAYSDSSEVDSGDTVPSSIAEDNPNASAHTISVDHTRFKDSESDKNTMTDGVVKSSFEMNSKPSNSKPQNVDPQAIDSRVLEPQKIPEHSKSGSKSDYFSSKSVPHVSNDKLPESSAISSTNSKRHSSHDPASRLRVSTDIARSKTSTESSDRPQAAQFHSLRKISTILRPNSKDKDSSDNSEPTQDRKASAPDSELARMKSALVTKNLQRKKDVLEDATCIMGNKITEGHENFVMAYNMLTGIRVAVSRCSGVMRNLSDSDFSETKKLTFDMDGTELTPSSKYDFKFKDYSPAVFRELRSLFGIDPADYLMSITGKYILSELGSSGKSGSFFYYSRDYRFIIKTIHHSEHKQLRRILKDYYLHVKNNPNTMVSQFYGLHRLKVQGGMKRIHFLVMNNLFPPHRDIHIKYDLKGSTWGRYTKIPANMQESGDISQLTLKDLNWLERKDNIKFGPEKKKIFLAQLEADIKLLKKINVMDYSLLLGIHDVKKGNSETVAKLSVFDPKSNLKAEVFKTNPRDIDRENDLPSDVFPGRSKYIFYGHNGGIRATNENNEPVSEIYYLGIIDCLTNYSFKKRLETAWRSLSHSRSTISALPAHEYGDRFLKFIKDGLSDVKVKIN
ncbi:hypothetical protein JCM33374_g4299 [Metschnikowia sp. JCM 33374]|nr:hypothetical protein JCM33374_g4299 [Metschnikowia sp. JCM 33374]